MDARIILEVGSVSFERARGREGDKNHEGVSMLVLGSRPGPVAPREEVQLRVINHHQNQFSPRPTDRPTAGQPGLGNAALRSQICVRTRPATLTPTRQPPPPSLHATRRDAPEPD